MVCDAHVEQQVVDRRLVLGGDVGDLGRQGEHDVEVSTGVENRPVVGVENSPLCFGLIASVASGWFDRGEVAEVEIDDGIERFCGGGLAEGLG